MQNQASNHSDPCRPAAANGSSKPTPRRGATQLRCRAARRSIPIVGRVFNYRPRLTKRSFCRSSFSALLKPASSPLGIKQKSGQHSSARMTVSCPDKPASLAAGCGASDSVAARGRTDRIAYPGLAERPRSRRGSSHARGCAVLSQSYRTSAPAAAYRLVPCTRV